jgi:hypothetical protein
VVNVVAPLRVSRRRAASRRPSSAVSVAVFRTSRRTATALGDPATVETLRSGTGLSGEQVRLIEELAVSGDGI